MRATAHVYDVCRVPLQLTLRTSRGPVPAVSCPLAQPRFLAFSFLSFFTLPPPGFPRHPAVMPDPGVVSQIVGQVAGIQEHLRSKASGEREILPA